MTSNTLTFMCLMRGDRMNRSPSKRLLDRLDLRRWNEDLEMKMSSGEINNKMYICCRISGGSAAALGATPWNTRACSTTLAQFWSHTPKASDDGIKRDAYFMLLSDDLLKFLEGCVEILRSPKTPDSILQCPPSTLVLLASHPAALIKLAHSKIHSFKFSEVPTCWRRLFTDASICQAVHVARANVKADDDTAPDQSDEGRDGSIKQELWIQEVVRLLDLAQIIAGAPGRAVMIEEILRALQDWLEADAELPLRKKRKTEIKCFPLQDRNVPRITREIPRLRAPTMADFEKHLPQAQPMVIEDALSHWPAFQERPWISPSYLLSKTFGGRRLIPVELGRSYTDDGWGQTIMTFREFMDRYMLSDLVPRQNGEDVDEGLDIAYLAQHDLFTQIPSLRNDISIPDYCYTDPPPPAKGTTLSKLPAQPKLEEPLLNAWFGPAGTVSPLHTDPYHNILCQVVGRKYVRLYSPSETENLYPRVAEEDEVDMSNTSQVDVEGCDDVMEKEFPRFREAKYVETVLAAGQALYVPVGWWHYVRSLDVSFSVSFWWN
ncbi:uncharacterized protein KY384_007039 [Bacidia gigantensis]|uniref:uncharacterized protein n=1 Tax=Bacidia gigantensis TaxID=2732470 RepID=UPI001D05A5FE|nr:uncharacterized protein KY384_007039 [Bacidia gigantensis]KAG8528123.1 hypothetical protein KY384_007039 [Bacidia gigantensis]